MIVTLAAVAFAAVCAAIVVFHIAAILGARLGPYTQGGAHPGALPMVNRVFAGLSAALTVLVALAVLGAAGIGPIWPDWTGWAALGFCGIATFANLATPSAPERRIWAPVSAVLLGLVCIVLLPRIA